MELQKQNNSLEYTEGSRMKNMVAGTEGSVRFEVQRFAGTAEHLGLLGLAMVGQGVQ